MAFPKKLGACVDQLYKLREERLKVERSADDMKKLETALRDHIINSFEKTSIEGARGSVATCSITRTIVPQVEDWTKFYAYIQKNKAWELLQKRPSDTAWRERFESGEEIPGTTPFTVIKLSTTRASKG